MGLWGYAAMDEANTLSVKEQFVRHNLIARPLFGRS
jgi:hypothetical protein